MKLEQNTLYLSMIVNFFIALIKIVGGIFWNTFTLTIDGIYTFSDLVTDVIVVFGIKIGRKRANKNHPFGYGRVFYVIQLFMGIISLFVGLFVIYLSFEIDYQKPSFFIIFVILGMVLLKFFIARKLFLVGRKRKSDLLLASSLESRFEAYSSLALIFIILFSFIFPKVDMIGGIIIAFILILQSIKIIWQNIILLIGITYEDQEIQDKVRKVVDKYPVIHIVDISLIKDGPYYQLTLTFRPKRNMKVSRLLYVQKKIKKELKAKTLGLKFIEFHLV